MERPIKKDSSIDYVVHRTVAIIREEIAQGVIDGKVGTPEECLAVLSRIEDEYSRRAAAA